jgi:hypothetical protein
LHLIINDHQWPVDRVIIMGKRWPRNQDLSNIESICSREILFWDMIFCNILSYHLTGAQANNIYGHGQCGGPLAKYHRS